MAPRGRTAAVGDRGRAVGSPLLAAHRSALGSVVVDIEDVYDEFNAGIPSPYALRDFLSYARKNWRTPPRYVVLAGDGTYDYHGREAKEEVAVVKAREVRKSRHPG